MKYDPELDELVPTEDLIRGDSDVVKSIAANIKEFAGSWDAVWENIELRARMKEEISKISEREQDIEILEAKFIIAANDKFHRLMDSTRTEGNHIDSERVFALWREWLEIELKKKRYE
jgi:hypothetical protein